MYEQIFRQLIFPALDRLNGTRIAQVLSHLADSESMSRAQLLELQERKLDRMLEQVRSESTFYRRFWSQADETRRAASHLPALDGVPVVNKEDLRAAIDEFPLPSTVGRVWRVKTSGSTGQPMTFLRSVDQESWFWALRIRMWTWAGWCLGEPYLAINLNRREAWKKRLQDALFRCTYKTYNRQNIRSQELVEILERRPIVHINAFGSSLLALAQHMARDGIANPGVKALTSTGDNLFPPQRQLIEDVFGVPVTDYYGAGGEGVHLASQCEEHDRYHLHVENAVIEVLKDGRPARPGEVGTIVVTQLDNEAMPLVRYDLGDLATVAEDEPCACGRAHPATLAAIDGRACDLVRMPNGGVLLPQFFFIGAFKMLEKVDGYQIVQDDIERILVKLVAEPGCDRRRSEASLEDEIARASDGSLQVDFAWVEEIPLAGIGKPRPVISNLG